MRSKHWILPLLFILLSISLEAGSFGKYDFTFYDSINNSIAIANLERIGFDYTGYGFIGENSTTGIYMRMGMQTPYTTIFSLFSNGHNSSSDSDEKDVKTEGEKPPADILESTDPITMQDEDTPPIIAEDTPKVKQTPISKEFLFSFTFGPAFRHKLSDDVIWYMGMGLSCNLSYTTQSTPNVNESISQLRMLFGSDFDMGFRLDMSKNSSFRIGVQMTNKMFTYSNTTLTGEKDSSTTQSLTADIFQPIGDTSNIDAYGYAGLGHMFKPSNRIVYRYSNKTPKLGGGTISRI